LYLLPQDPKSAAGDRASERATHEAAITVRSATSSVSPFDLTAVTDDDRETVWASPPQRGGEEVVLDLGGSSTVTGLSLSSGPALEGYPRLLTVAVSVDGLTWDETWSGSMAGPTIEGVLEDAARAAGRISFPARQARFVRLRQLASQPDFGWFIAELKVYGLLPS
jgi:F5/8 type C domain-containing protein